MKKSGHHQPSNVQLFYHASMSSNNRWGIQSEIELKAILDGYPMGQIDWCNAQLSRDAFPHAVGIYLWRSAEVVFSHIACVPHCAVVWDKLDWQVGVRGLQ